MPSLDFVPFQNMMVLDYQQRQDPTLPNYTPTPAVYHSTQSPEYPNSYHQVEEAAEMYRHTNPAGYYHSVYPYNYAAAAAQQQGHFSPEFTLQFQHQSMGPTALNLSSCAKKTESVAVHQPSPVSPWSSTASYTTSYPSSNSSNYHSSSGYPSSPATGGSELGTGSSYQTIEGYANNLNPEHCDLAFPNFTGTSPRACAIPAASAIPNSVPTFEHFTTGYPTVPTAMFAGEMAQHGLPGFRCSHDWVKTTNTMNTYGINPQTGKTRTKEKYRVVYSTHQRLELEKEFQFSHTITTKRKSELAVYLSLSERQVKIWFQNRRAKDRKQNKKLLLEQESNQQVDLDRKEKHDEAVASPVLTAIPAASEDHTKNYQQHHLTNGDGFIMRSACAHSKKTEPVDLSFVSAAAKDADDQRLNMRNDHAASTYAQMRQHLYT